MQICKFYTSKVHGNRLWSFATTLLLPCCQVQSKDRAFSFRDDTYSQGELYQMFQEILGVSALDHQMFAAKKQVCGVEVWDGTQKEGVDVWEREGVGVWSGAGGKVRMCGRGKVLEVEVGEGSCGSVGGGEVEWGV